MPISLIETFTLDNDIEGLKMENIYINKLINTIEKTRFLDCYNNYSYLYDEGIDRLVDVFFDHKEKDSRLFFIGNGGSSAIASHMTADFMKNGGMNTYSLYDNAVTTCMGNDYGYEYVFSRPLEFLVKENDLVVAISSSGNSKNIINAINVAKSKRTEVITFTGFSEDNKAIKSGDYNVYVPSYEYGIVESIHNIVLQHVVDIIKERDGIRI